MSAFTNFLKKSKLLIGIVIVIVLGYLAYFYFYFSKITDNAYVVANVRPVATSVSGIVKDICVKNGQFVQKGQVLLQLDDTAYKNAYLIAKMDFMQQQKAYQEAQEKFENGKLSYKAYMLSQSKFAQAKARENIAKANLDATRPRALSDGIISNMFLAPGAPAEAYKPLFVIVDTSKWWVQANFKETDLGGVKVGQKANIRLRMYLGDKVYHGVVESVNWAVGRQQINQASYLQQIPSENQWLLLPQRFPVLIRIKDPDPHYPLHVGASAYVSLVS